MPTRASPGIASISSCRPARRTGKFFWNSKGLKQAGRFWVNGKFAGKYENGVTPCGLDLTGFVNFGDAENVIAVKVDNSNDYKEEATGVEFEWMGRAFNPNYGGLNHDIWLHLTGKVYQTLPLYENLKTTGVYIYPSDFSIAEQNLRRERRIAGAQRIRRPAIHHAFGGGRGRGRQGLRANLRATPSDLVSGETEIFKAAGKLADAQFWSDERPVSLRRLFACSP